MSLCIWGENKWNVHGFAVLQWLNKKFNEPLLQIAFTLYDKYCVYGGILAELLHFCCLTFYLCIVYCSLQEYTESISFLFFKSLNIFYFCCVSSQVIKVLWWYYFSKLIEFMDTFFFILRKNNRQITFLHIYHHASMLNIWWFVMNWIPCGHCECFNTTLPSSDSNHSSALMLNPLALKTDSFPHKALTDTKWHLLTLNSAALWKMLGSCQFSYTENPLCLLLLTQNNVICFWHINMFYYLSDAHHIISVLLYC